MIPNAVKYNDLTFRCCSALFAAHKIVTINEKESFFEFLVMPYYYPALFGSFIIAFILIEIIYRVTCRLDRRFPWEDDLVNRVLWQVMLGVIFTVCLAAVLASVYFYLSGASIKDTLYFDSEYFVIALLIVIFNLYYLVHYLFKVFVFPSTTEEEKQEESDLEVQNFVDMDVVVIYSANHHSFALTASGEQLVWPYNIKESGKHLPADRYFTVNRWCIVRKDIIDRAVRPEVLKEDRVAKSIPYEVHLKIPFHKPVTTSYRKAVEFKKWLDG